MGKVFVQGVFMSSSPSSHKSWRRIGLASSLVVALASVGLSGCQSFGDTTGSISATRTTQPAPNDQAGWRAEADRWAKAYDANPGEKVASINYARALRACGRFSEAVSIMRVAAVKAPKDYEVLGAYGKALADDGDLAQARDILARSYPLERPDWTILSVQGSVEDKLGNFDQAQTFYIEALRIAPGEPSILTNLGLSYALNKQLPSAEQSLREAAASPRADSRTRQNLALILSLEGKYAEAESISRQDMSPEEARANVQSIQMMIAQNDTWRALQPKGMKAAQKPPPKTAAAPADPQG
jgi:Flp pilus assembly protein TadD